MDSAKDILIQEKLLQLSGFDPRPLQSMCQNVLQQGTEPQIALSASANILEWWPAMARS